ELEGITKDRVREADAVADAKRGGRELERSLLVAELHRDGLVGSADAIELIDEVHVPRGTPELPVGRRLEPYVLLHPHDGADGLVLPGPEVLGRDRALGKVLAGPHQLRRSQQAPHVVSAKRWRHANGAYAANT